MSIDASSGVCTRCHDMAEPCRCPSGHVDDPTEPVDDGAGLLDRVRSFICRFVSFPSASAGDAVTVWVAHCHLVASFDSSPRLALLSPEPGSGKTRTLEVAELLVPEPMHVLSASPSAVFRTVAKTRPTLLMDEVDAVFRQRGKDDGNEDLRALLNAGHRRGATIPRCCGPSHDVCRFPVYAAAALAGLGDLPDTLMSRSVIVRMRRRGPGERVEPFRHRVHAAEGHELRDRLAEWARDIAEKVTNAWPVMPDGVSDRPADCWEALLAVADAAGGHWPDTARAACTELVKVTETREASLGIRLLTDLRAVFGDRDVMSTAAVLDALHGLDESPWSDLRGKPLDARGLARRLAAYGIASTKVRAGQSLRGYRREDLWDTFTRYLPPPDPAEAEPTEQAEPCRSQAPEPVPLPGIVPEQPSGTEQADPPLTSEVPPVPEVPDFAVPETDTGGCAVCGQPLDPALAAAGDRTHASCDPGGTA